MATTLSRDSSSIAGFSDECVGSGILGPNSYGLAEEPAHPAISFAPLNHITDDCPLYEDITTRLVPQNFLGNLCGYQQLEGVGPTMPSTMLAVTATMPDISWNTTPGASHTLACEVTQLPQLSNPSEPPPLGGYQAPIASTPGPSPTPGQWAAASAAAYQQQPEQHQYQQPIVSLMPPRPLLPQPIDPARQAAIRKNRHRTIRQGIDKRYKSRKHDEREAAESETKRLGDQNSELLADFRALSEQKLALMTELHAHATMRACRDGSIKEYLTYASEEMQVPTS